MSIIGLAAQGRCRAWGTPLVLWSQDVYPDLDQYYEDLGKAYAKAVKAFYDAGCRYLQLDDTVWAYLCSQEEQEKMRGRGDQL